LSSLTYGIVGINKLVTYVTNEVLTTKHDLCLNATIMIWTYLIRWMAADSIRSIVPCTVKELSLLHIILQKKYHSLCGEPHCLF